MRLYRVLLFWMYVVQRGADRVKSQGAEIGVAGVFAL